MSSRSSSPLSQTPATPPTAISPQAQRRRRNRLISLAYGLGLLLVFILSLLLLPAETGVGRLLWGAL